MKKFLSLLMLLTVAIPSLMAVEKSYTIMLDKTQTSNSNSTALTAENFVATVVNSGAEYISAVTEINKVYELYNENGIRIGQSSNAGTLTLSISELGQVIPTKIVINNRKYSTTSSTLTLKYGTSEGTKTVNSSRSPLTDWTDFEYTITGETAAMTSITLSTTKRASFKSITGRLYYLIFQASASRQNLIKPRLSAFVSCKINDLV